MSVMGFDPLADRGTAPFANSDTCCDWAKELGVGLRDLKRNEVVGVPIADVRFDFAAVRERILREQESLIRQEASFDAMGTTFSVVLFGEQRRPTG